MAFRTNSALRTSLFLAGVVLFVLGSFSSPTRLFAQHQDLRFERLPLRGLPHTTVRSIIQDRKGFMWFGTDDGLVRYDGHGYSVFKPDTGYETGNPYRVETVFQDAQGIFWIGTRRNGLDRFDPSTEQFTTYRHDPENPNSLSHDEAWRIVGGRDGIVWVGTAWESFNRFEPETGTFTRYGKNLSNPDSLTGRVVHSMLEDRNGILWVGTGNFGLSRFDHDTGQFTRYLHSSVDQTSLSDNIVKAILEDREGTLWVGVGGPSGGLHRFDREMGRFKRYQHNPRDPSSISSNMIESIEEDSFGNLWIGTFDGGLNLFDRTSERFTHSVHDPGNKDSPSSNFVADLFEDDDGVLWLATFGVGVNRLVRSPEWFTHWQHDPLDPNSLDPVPVKAIFEGPEAAHMLWVGTQGTALNQLDLSTGRVSKYPYAPSPNNVGAIHEDQSGTVWLGLGLEHLGKLNPATGLFIKHQYDSDNPETSTRAVVVSIHEGPSGLFWFGTPYGRIEQFDPLTEMVTYKWSDPEMSSIPSNRRIDAILEEESGSVWLGVGGLGLKRLDPLTDQVVAYKFDSENPNSLSSNYVQSLHKDRQGRLWIGTSRGLNLWDAELAQFTRFTRPHAPLRDNIRGILEDKYGNLWLSTADGLSIFRTEQGKESLIQHFSNISMHRLGEFILGAEHAGASGALYFGGREGLVVIHPDRIHDAPPHPVYITDVEINGEPLEIRDDEDSPLTQILVYSDELVLQQNTDDISFTFTALNFSMGPHSRYAYRLEGDSEDWIYLNTARKATFFNLSPGSYVLHVKTANTYGVWGEVGSTLRIVILPTWWQTWWFRIVAMFLIMGLMVETGRRLPSRGDQQSIDA